MWDEPLRHLFIIEPKIKGAVSKSILTAPCVSLQASSIIVAGGLFHEHEVDGTHKQCKGCDMIPSQFESLEGHDAEHYEHHKSDHFLHHFELYE